MKQMSFEQMEEVNAGKLLERACAVIAVGTAVYEIGAIYGQWSPIGWISDAFLVSVLACGAALGVKAAL